MILLLITSRLFSFLSHQPLTDSGKVVNYLDCSYAIQFISSLYLIATMIKFYIQPSALRCTTRFHRDRRYSFLMINLLLPFTMFPLLFNLCFHLLQFSKINCIRNTEGFIFAGNPVQPLHFCSKRRGHFHALFPILRDIFQSPMRLWMI